MKSLRCALASAGFICCAPCGSAWAVDGDATHWLREGDDALRSGHPQRALDAFERAAAQQHSAAIEVGIVRALMRTGEYRRALAFAGHTAVAHADSSEGAALYAELLRVGGQAEVARRLLEAARQRAPDDAGLLRALAALLASDTGAAVQATSRSTDDAAVAAAVVIGNATLLPDARHAVMPTALIRLDGSLWLRNGLGHTVQAELVRSDAGSGLALLRLSEALPAPPAFALAPREPFAGSPATTVAFRTGSQRDAPWPQLSVGFLGMPLPSSNSRWLGIDAAADSAGAPVFDTAGRLAGVVLPSVGDSGLRVAGVAALAALSPPTAATATDAPPASAAAPRAVDEVYERALRSALQLLVAAP